MAHLERGAAICRATGQGHLCVPMLLGQGMIRGTRGDLAGAAQVAADAEEIARLAHNAQWLTWGLTLRTWVEHLSGDIPRALRAGEEAVEASDRVSEHYYSVLARCFLAAAHLDHGEPDRCVDGLPSACDGVELRPIERPFRPHLYEILVRAELARKRVGPARDFANVRHPAAQSQGV